MKGVLKLEAIGDNTYQLAKGLSPIFGPGPKRNYWVAQIIDFTESNYVRDFIRPKKDYSKANSVGSRGVFLYYILESGKVYEVSEPLSWSRTQRFFCKVGLYGEIIKIDAEEVAQWIRNHSV